MEFRDDASDKLPGWLPNSPRPFTISPRFNQHDLSRAEKFRDSFVPELGVDYEWVLTRAKDYFQSVDKAMEQVDTKANTIINYFGSGAGIMAFVAMAGVATNQVTVYTALATIPSFIAAIFAMVLATYARGAKSMYPPVDGGVGKAWVDGSIGFLQIGRAHV